MNFFKYAKRYAMSEDNFIVFCQVFSVIFSFVKGVVLLGFGIGLKNLAFVIIGAAVIITLTIIIATINSSSLGDEWIPLVVCFSFCLIINPFIFILLIINVSNNKSSFSNATENRKLKIEYEDSYDKI